MSSSDAVHHLDYATPQPNPWWRRWPNNAIEIWCALPLPAAAIILLTPIYLAYIAGLWDRIAPYAARRGVFMAALFLSPLLLASVIRRRRLQGVWLPLGILACMAGLAPLIGFTFSDYQPYGWLAIDFVPILGFLVVEWLARHRTERSPFLGNVLSALGLTTMLSMGETFMRWSAIQFEIRKWHPFDNRRWSHDTNWFDLGSLCYPLYSTLIIAVVIPWMVQIKTDARRRRAILIASISAIASFILLFGPLCIPLARLSMRGHGPFSRRDAAALIQRRGSSADADCVIAALDRCGWPDLELHSDTSGWKHDAVRVVVHKNPARAAERISQILLNNPRAHVAEQFAGLLASQHRYETAPLLLRFALLEESQSGRAFYTAEINRALTDMGVPQMAYVVLTDAWTWSRIKQSTLPSPLGRPPREVTNLTFNYLVIDAETQERLKAILRKHAGDDVKSWLDLYYAKLAASPVPPSVLEECEQVRRCMANYIETRFNSANSNIQWPSLERAPTTDELVRRVAKYVEQVRQESIRSQY